MESPPSPCPRRTGLRPQTWRSSSSSQHQGGDHLHHQVVATGVAQHHKQICLFAAPGYGGAQDVASSPRLQLCPCGSYASEDPGTVAMATRRIVSTSEGGGRPSRQSRPERRWLFFTFTQHKQFATISNRSCCPWR